MDITPENSISVIDNTIYKNSGLNNMKSSSLNAMFAKHEDASKVMKDAVEIICKRSEVSEDENHKSEQISNELDKLLREE